MPIQHAIWKVSAAQPQRLQVTRLQNEALLEDMIAAQIGILSEEWMLIGRQIHTGSGGRIDLLAIAPDTERIVRYLSERGIPINVLFFEVFAHGAEQLLSRSWLIKPERTQVNAAASSVTEGPREWNGEFYANFGQGESRSWDEARKYGFISAGGGAWYSNTLQLLNPGDRVWVNIPGSGFVGVGRVKARVQSAAEFHVNTPDGDRPALEVLTQGNYHRQSLDDPAQYEYFVPIDWLQTVPIANAISEIGLFRNQNTVCKPVTPKWRSTVARLQERFPNWDAPPNQHGEVPSVSTAVIAAA